ncbi:hypothetical protein C7N43_00080 [Sphingobacteriales bacterium UPWRP_1]|nr:hypothetical protein BVG80_15010 [Sphingobacteriales bacterium TSM_CSM]PSJ79059.1 hypothetical protein C7N43_00080 [Sphingobacteriales bacterium UPWRP_1]
MKQYTLLIALVLLLFVALLNSCGSKTTKETQQTPKPAKDTAKVQLDADAQIGTDAGKWGPDSVETVKNYSLYREYYKQKLYADALPFWRYVYKNAPAARKTTYLNGVTMYETFAEQTKDSVTKQAYVDTMFMIYDQRIANFGEEGDVTTWKAVKLKNFRPWETAKYMELVKHAVAIQQEEADYFLLVPYFNDWLSQYNQKKVSKEKVLEQYNMLSDIIDYNLNNNTENADMYRQVKEVLDGAAAKLQTTTTTTVTAAASCADIKNAYEAQFRANSNDADLVKTLYGKLSRSNCKADALYSDVFLKLYQLEPTAQRAKLLAQMYADKGDNNTAQKYVQEAINLETDRAKQASLYMLMAGLERRKSNALTVSTATQARKYAKKAAELRPGWGKPYIFIGDLYASSGKLCGPGTGWDSQVVAWAATDMWEKARDIDPDFAAEATQSINRYRQYYPKTSDGFMRGYANGQSYNIGCWIGTTTTIRLINE